MADLQEAQVVFNVLVCHHYVSHGPNMPTNDYGPDIVVYVFTYNLC